MQMFQVFTFRSFFLSLPLCPSTIESEWENASFSFVTVARSIVRTNHYYFSHLSSTLMMWQCCLLPCLDIYQLFKSTDDTNPDSLQIFTYCVHRSRSTSLFCVVAERTMPLSPRNAHRSRWTIFRYVVFWLMVVTTMKLTIVFYNDLQQQSLSERGASSLPFDDARKLRDSKARIIQPIVDQAGSSFSTSSPFNRTMIDTYRRNVRKANREQHMYNSNLFSPNATRYILLVQVHTRVVYLRKFIEMLKAVRTIEQTLLIFSHDFIDPDINALVTNITFVPVRWFAFSQNSWGERIVGSLRNISQECRKRNEANKVRRILVCAPKRRAGFDERLLIASVLFRWSKFSIHTRNNCILTNFLVSIRRIVRVISPNIGKWYIVSLR